MKKENSCFFPLKRWTPDHFENENFGLQNYTKNMLKNKKDIFCNLRSDNNIPKVKNSLSYDNYASCKNMKKTVIKIPSAFPESKKVQSYKFIEKKNSKQPIQMKLINLVPFTTNTTSIQANAYQRRLKSKTQSLFYSFSKGKCQDSQTKF